MSENIVFKAKISTNLGTFEFEGGESFVKEQVKNVLDSSQKIASPNSPLPSANTSPNLTPPQAPAKVVGKRSVSVGEQPKLLSNLITEPSKIQELKKFVEDKNPINQMEIFAVLAHWMKYNLNLEEVSIDEMWTSYKILGKKAPKVLIQVFRDGKSKKGWFNVGTSSGKYTLTSIGETFVEHDLPSIVKGPVKTDKPQDNQLPLEN